MYPAVFSPFPTLQEKCAYWSRHIWFHRSVQAHKPVSKDLVQLIKDEDYFVLTTNVGTSFRKQVPKNNASFAHKVIMDYGNVPFHAIKKPMTMKIPCAG